MTFENRATQSSPEGVEIDFVVAGLGSRLLARLLDMVVQAAIVYGVAMALTPLMSIDGLTGYALAALTIAMFLIVFAYDVVFDTFAAGRSIGKRVNKLRVVREGGQPVGFLASAIRNAVRVIDYSLFGIGVLLIASSRRNQRLGDFAAGTLVVRDVSAGSANVPLADTTGFATVPLDDVKQWDVSQISTAEVAVIRRFLDRRTQLPAATRSQLANRIVSDVWSRIPNAPNRVHPEFILEGILVAKAL